MNPVSTWDLKTDNLINELKNGKRLDGRAFDEARKISITKGFSKNADGSVFVKLGETQVIGGIKLSPMTPYPDSPNMGTISVGAELLALASPVFEVGPPGEDAVELARVVDRGIREGHAIDFEKLLIREGELAWTVFIDLYILNDAGNLFDACSVAAIASLLDTRVPRLEGDKIVFGEYDGKLKVQSLPLLSTFAKISNINVLDPVFLEEKAMSCRFSVATTDDDKISAFQKGGSGSLTPKDVSELVEIAFKNAKKSRKLIESSIK